MKLDKRQILKEIKKHYNFSTDAEFARFLEVKPQVLSNWYARNTFDYDILYTKCVDVNPGWFFSGEGEMLKNNPITQANAEMDTIADNISEPDLIIHKLKTDYFNIDKQVIPLYELEATAGLNNLFANQNTQIPLDYINVPNAPKCDGALSIRGDSMYPLLKTGDIVCYKVIHDLGNIYYGEMHLIDIDIEGDQFLSVKYVKQSKLGDNYVLLLSYNEHYAPKDILKSQIRAIALVKMTIRYNTTS
ncbi:S24 family peptidase [Dysgonomonas sp. 520]|uniref:LexA family transcriptional regulator n=1 Tax=Dysgonomonas sp. 520 TaxID=2302931 RepID=UPI0013D0D9F5|nr:S24 family peptidase [Dysgonomonas sp. 520]NDW10484.1 transcriptional regulator [Dysgonomonas sp. 520]